MSRIKIAVVFGLGVFFLWTACRGGELPGAKIKVGEKMADFTLQDVNGKTHSLYDFEGKKAVAVIFFATRCPYSNAFNHVMASLAHEYESRGVAVIGINANKTEPVAEVAEHARAHGLDFLILKDEGNQIADRLGASVTPEVFRIRPADPLGFVGKRWVHRTLTYFCWTVNGRCVTTGRLGTVTSPPPTLIRPRMMKSAQHSTPC